MVSHCGNIFCCSYIPELHSHCCALLRNTGVILIGKDAALFWKRNTYLVFCTFTIIFTHCIITIRMFLGTNFPRFFVRNEKNCWKEITTIWFADIPNYFWNIWFPPKKFLTFWTDKDLYLDLNSIFQNLEYWYLISFFLITKWVRRKINRINVNRCFNAKCKWINWKL